MTMYVVLNPHVSDFYFEPISYRIIKRRALKKYNYIFTGNPSGEPRPILIDGSGTGMMPMGLFLAMPLFLRMTVCRMEIAWWLRINKLKGKVKVFYKKEKLDQSLILFSFAYKIFKSNNHLVETAQYFRASIFHLSHYHGYTKQMSSTLSKINNCHLAADADISKGEFFQQYFSWYKKPILVVSFEVGSRFQNQVPIASRKNKAIALGTFHRFENAGNGTEKDALGEYITFTGAHELHPIRRQIYEHADECASYIDSMISPYIEKQSGILTKFFKVFFSQQKKYFSFDIVKKYNEYQFAIIGEELHNRLPGIGAFEAMGCGCILIGNSNCYDGLKMKEGVDYIGYTGGLDELLEAIEKGRNLSVELLQKMSLLGIEYVNENFTHDCLSQKFENTIASIKTVETTSNS